MNEKTLLIQSGKKLLHEGFTVETWGNISLRGADGLVYITPSGMDYDTCTEEDIVVMDLEGHVVEGSRVPSIEHGLHRAVYAARPEVNAIVHTHPIYSTVFSAMGESIPLLIDEAAQALGDQVRTAPYALPGTDELARACAEALGQKANACLLQSHGAVCDLLPHSLHRRAVHSHFSRKHRRHAGFCGSQIRPAVKYLSMQQRRAAPFGAARLLLLPVILPAMGFISGNIRGTFSQSSPGKEPGRCRAR